MAGSTIDLDALRRFRDTLERINHEMAAVRRVLAKSVDESHQYWSDEQRPLFTARFSELKLPLEIFEKKAVDYIDWADRKHAAGQTYLHGGPRR